jgi:hypothetical protein
LSPLPNLLLSLLQNQKLNDFHNWLET